MNGINFEELMRKLDAFEAELKLLKEKKAEISGQLDELLGGKKDAEKVAKKISEEIESIRAKVSSQLKALEDECKDIGAD